MHGALQDQVGEVDNFRKGVWKLNSIQIGLQQMLFGRLRGEISFWIGRMAAPSKHLVKRRPTDSENLGGP
jgi:hypothetical protein